MIFNLLKQKKKIYNYNFYNIIFKARYILYYLYIFKYFLATNFLILLISK